MTSRDDIEITDEMVEAGIQAARIYSREDSLVDIVTSIYQAMRPLENETPQPSPAQQC